MKTFIWCASFCFVALMSSSCHSSSQGTNLNGQETVSQTSLFPQSAPGVVEVISASYQQLPQSVKEWLQKNFNGIATTDIKFHTLAGIYDVTLANGYETEFSTTGEVIAMIAPAKLSIATSLLTKIIPSLAFNYLEKEKLSKDVIEMRKTDGDIYLVRTATKSFFGLEKRQRFFAFDAKGHKVKLPQMR